MSEAAQAVARIQHAAAVELVGSPAAAGTFARGWSAAVEDFDTLKAGSHNPGAQES